MDNSVRVPVADVKYDGSLPLVAKRVNHPQCTTKDQVFVTSDKSFLHTWTFTDWVIPLPGWIHLDPTRGGFPTAERYWGPWSGN